MLLPESCYRVETQLAAWIGLVMSGLMLVAACSNPVVTIWFLIALLASSLLGCMLVFIMTILSSPEHFVKTPVPSRVGVFQHKVLELVTKRNRDKVPVSLPIIMNRNVSTALQNLLDLIFRDLGESFLGYLGLPGIDCAAHIKNDAWEILHKLYTKLSRIDPVQFITQDVVIRVTCHLEKIRLSQSTLESKEKMSPYILSSFLASPQAELELLRKLSDVIIVNLFPRSYIDCLPLRHMLREVLACQVLQPCINTLCNPDTINQQLVTQLRLGQLMSRNFTYAASYEDFVSLIEDCDELNELEQIRCNIVTEIAQATAISTVKRSKGMDLEQEFTPLGPTKVDLLQARNLKRYIKQLTCAKLQCERRLRTLGAHLNDAGARSTSTSVSNFVADDMVPSFKTVMRNYNLRHELEVYLTQQGECQVKLLRFWLAAQDLRKMDRKLALAPAAQLFYNYFHGASPIVKLDKSLLKAMEGFITGDRGPEAFYQAQDHVWKIIEERHYPSFLVALTCRTTVGRQPASCEPDGGGGALKDRNFSWKDVAVSEQSHDKAVVEWSEQHQQARTRIEQLDARLTVKVQALRSLRSIAPLDNTLVMTLEREVESLQTERREVDSWINQAETWAAHMGQWKATVMLPQSADEKECLRFPVEVYLEDEESLLSTTSASGANVSRNRVAMSWVVWRQVADFYSMHSKLSQQCAWLKSSQLPNASGKTLFGKPNDRAYIEGAQDKLQCFLNAVMADDHLNKSEGLFMFLHNPPACLRPSVNAPKKSRFSLATLFKSDAARESDEDNEHEHLAGTDETDSLFQSAFTDEIRDGIAEPIYHLISEAFELRGVFGWLRRALVTFVHITYGRNINRQIREVVSNLFSDQAVLGYLQSLLKTYWPEGLLLPPPAERSAQEKLRTKQEARELLVANVPDVLLQLIGQQNARQGILRIFHILQDERLNKQLFYDLLQLVINDAFPELSALPK